MTGFGIRKNFDYLLFAAILLTILLGIITLYSATYGIEGEKSGLLWKRQLIWLGIGLVSMLFAILFDYQTLGIYARSIYGASILLLILVLFFGTTIRHARSWFVLGPISFQPSELAKFTTLLMLAAYLQDKQERLKELASLIPALLIVGLPMLLIMKQPDTGTALVFLPVLLVMLYVAGARKIHLVSFLSIGLLSLLLPLTRSWMEFKPDPPHPLFASILKLLGGVNQILVFLAILLFIAITLHYILRVVGITLSLRHLLGGYVVLALGLLSSLMVDGFLKGYQRMRLLVFLSPDIDPLGAGYNIIQSKIAIGSGGIVGRGLLAGTQNQLGFLPEHQTDFIFSVIGEEWGFIGVLVLLLLFLIIISQGLYIADTSRDMFGSLLASGITAAISFQILLNIGMTVGIIPVVGVPLPLVSYGGSSLIMTMTALGVLLNIRLRRFLA